MSLKARLTASILALVAVIVVSLSVLYLSAVAENRVTDAQTVASLNAQQVVRYISRRAQAEAAKLMPPPQSEDEIVEAFVAAVRTDPDLPRLLQELMGNSPVIVEGVVTGPDDRILSASIETKRGQIYVSIPSIEDFERKTPWARLIEVLSGRQEYEVVQTLGMGDREVFRVHMILSSVLLREELLPRIEPLALVSVVALLLSLLAAAVVSQLAVRPFEHISERIDRIARGDMEKLAEPRPAQARELAVVESKLDLLGEQFRGAQDDARRLRGNIGQLLARLEEAVLLFGRDDRLMMAGGAAERLIGMGRWEMMGKTLEAVFPDHTELGALVASAKQLRRSFKDRQVMYRIVDGRPQHLLVSIELVEEFPNRDRLGTLVTLREAEPRRQIQSQLDVSTRLAAISRLTSGAAHEIKNPLNSIALHLELLRARLEARQIQAEEIDVISREITRLDRVVKSFLDFTRPVELNIAEVDLAGLLEELASLLGPDARRQDVRVEVGALPGGAVIQADRDLLKQALLNVMVNGVQAMPEGGELSIALEQNDDEWLIRIRDEGVGIPPEARDKIYQLYFTTKGRGSGIGLPMSFQAIQLHGGTIDFVSETGCGTEFRIQLPAVKPSPDSPGQALTRGRTA